MAPLTYTEQQILAMERQWWTCDAVKASAIEARLGMSSIRYYQALNTLVDSPSALVADPVLVNRLRRRREARRESRTVATRPLM